MTTASRRPTRDREEHRDDDAGREPGAGDGIGAEPVGEAPEERAAVLPRGRPRRGTWRRWQGARAEGARTAAAPGPRAPRTRSTEQGREPEPGPHPRLGPGGAISSPIVSGVPGGGAGISRAARPRTAISAAMIEKTRAGLVTVAAPLRHRAQQRAGDADAEDGSDDLAAARRLGARAISQARPPAQRHGRRRPGRGGRRRGPPTTSMKPNATLEVASSTTPAMTVCRAPILLTRKPAGTEKSTAPKA